MDHVRRQLPIGDDAEKYRDVLNILRRDFERILESSITDFLTPAQAGDLHDQYERAVKRLSDIMEGMADQPPLANKTACDFLSQVLLEARQ